MGRPRLAPGEHGQPWVVPTPTGHRAAVRVRDRDGQVREVTASAATKGAALRRLQRKIESRRAPTTFGVRADMTVDELASYWLAQRARNGGAVRGTSLRPQTLASYADVQRLVISPILGKVRIGELTVGLLDTALADLEDAGVATAQARSVLNQMLGLGVRHGALGANPMALVARPARERREVEALDLEQVHRLREHVDPDTRRKPGCRGPNRDLAEFVDLALATGCRISEILALQWRHVDLVAALPTVLVSGTLVEPRPGYVERLHRQEQTKSGRARSLILPGHAVGLLGSRRERSRHDGDVDPVFASRNGTWLWPNNLRTRLRAALPADLAGTTPHTLRRTVGTRIAHEAGLDAARDQLGHSAAGVTWQAYVAQRSVAPDLRHVLDAFFTDPSPATEESA